MIQIKKADMRRALLSLPLLVAACATPLEYCINHAQRELRVVNGLIAETQGNIARGYAIGTRQDVVTYETTCGGIAADGTPVRVSCQQVDTRDRRVPVAIDLNAETRKLTSLLDRQAQMQRTAEQAVKQCAATYPA
jgi:hypothetical protein